MLPNATGEPITVPANDSIVKERDYTIDGAWVARNCEIIAFVQNNSSKEIYQGARVGVYQVPALEYRGYQSAFPEPGGTADLVIGLRNLGSGLASGVSATLSTTDPYVTVTGANGSFDDIAIGADVYSSAAFGISVAGNCPDPHLATMDLAVTAAGGYSRQRQLPAQHHDRTRVLGRHGGRRERLDSFGHARQLAPDEHRNQSPANSWYCGVENTWRYTDENDATAGDTLLHRRRDAPAFVRPLVRA